MPTRNGLKDVNPICIALCKKGANRKRIFLRKTDEEPNVHTREAPLIRKAAGDSWSVMYAVVAEPGWEENPGQTGDPDSVDVWLNADEIRKAAHRLLKNQGYVAANHDEPALDGAHIVESAVALADFQILQPDGSLETIRKDSWYIGIEPPEDVRAQVDAGEIEAISLEGEGLRVPLEKSHAGENTAGPIRHLISFYMKKPHPFTACVRDNRKRFGDRAEAICATLKDMGKGTHDWRKGGGKMRKADDADAFVGEWEGKLRAAGLDDDGAEALMPWMEEQRMLHEQTEQKGALKKMWDALFGADEESPFADDEPADPPAYAELLAKAADLSPEDREGLAKELGTLDDRTSEEESDMGLREDFDAHKSKTESDFAELKKSSDATVAAVEGLTGVVDKLIDRVAPEKKADEDDDTKGDKTDVKKSDKDPVELLGKLADRMDGFDDDLQAIAKAIDASSTQDKGGDTIKKTSDNPLAGLLQL